MQESEIYRWLFENGGPVIRYRTANELLPPSSGVDTGHLLDEVIQSPQVRRWLERLNYAADFLHLPDDNKKAQILVNQLHGSKDTALENVLGKLIDFGLKKGVPEFDNLTLPYRQWLRDTVECPAQHIFDVFCRTLVAAFLSRAGYTDDHAVAIILKNRLDNVHDFVRKGNYDIYVSSEGYRKMPASFRNRALINPTLTTGGNVRLPLIYDIAGWASYLSECGTEEELSKADTVINYILNNEYQKLPWGYGILLGDHGGYYAMGWSVHLPRFFGAPDKKYTNKSVVQMVNLLINFRVTRQHSWFTKSLNHLEEFRTDKGTYLFPRDYLQEKPQGYWVNGVRMRLGDSLELESTFWMMKFKKLLQSQ